MLSLGALTVALAYGWTLRTQGGMSSTHGASFFTVLAMLIVLGLLIEGIGLVFHARDLIRNGGEGAAAHYLQRTDFGYTWRAHNAGFALAIMGASTLAVVGAGSVLLWSLLALVIVPTALVGRALFYVLVVPTTLPGAFFWRNPGFQEHARETGLANLPQVGVVPNGHG